MRAEKIGKTVLEKFKEFQENYAIIGDVRGLGAMVGMELVVDQKTKEPATNFTKQLIDQCRNDRTLDDFSGDLFQYHPAPHAFGDYR